MTIEDMKHINMLCETQPAYIVHRKQGEYTIEDYYALPDECRAELIDGVLYDMGAPTTFHQTLVLELGSAFKDYIRSRKGKCVSLISPVDVQLDCDNKTMVQPDVMVVCDRDKFKDGRIYGAPDFVAEILSPSTARKDRYIKLSKYMNAGVRECWLVDPEQKRIYVHEWKREDAFAKTYTFDEEVSVGIFDGECKLDFREIYGYVKLLE